MAVEDLQTAKETGDEQEVEKAKEEVKAQQEKAIRCTAKVEKAKEEVKEAKEEVKAQQEKAIRCTASVCHSSPERCKNR